MKSSSYPITCFCKNPTLPIYYFTKNTYIDRLLSTDGVNSYGLYFPINSCQLNIKGFPSNTFTGNWTIEFFVYFKSSKDAIFTIYPGQIIGSTNSESLPIEGTNNMPPGSTTVDGLATSLGFTVNVKYQNKNPIFTGTVNTLESRGTSGKDTLKGSSADVTSSYSGNWFSIVIQYNSASSTSNYSILVTPKGGNTVNIVDPNSQQTNFGTQGAIKTLVFGGADYKNGLITDSNGASEYYITNLRISNIARYPNPPLSSSLSSTLPPTITTSTPTTPSTPILWPNDPSFKSDSNTVYFNSFNILDTTTSKGYLLSQIVQII